MVSNIPRGWRIDDISGAYSGFGTVKNVLCFSTATEDLLRKRLKKRLGIHEPRNRSDQMLDKWLNDLDKHKWDIENFNLLEEKKKRLEKYLDENIRYSTNYALIEFETAEEWRLATQLHFRWGGVVIQCTRQGFIQEN